MATGPEPHEQERQSLHVGRQQASTGFQFSKQPAFHTAEYRQSRLRLNRQCWSAALHRGLIGQPPESVVRVCFGEPAKPIARGFAGKDQSFPNKAQPVSGESQCFAQPIFLVRQRVQRGQQRIKRQG